MNKVYFSKVQADRFIMVRFDSDLPLPLRHQQILRKLRILFLDFHRGNKIFTNHDRRHIRRQRSYRVGLGVAILKCPQQFLDHVPDFPCHK